MDAQLLMKTAALAGELMLCSGAETYRVEDTMHHILKTADNLEMAEVLVIMTGITATIKQENENVISIVKRVNSRSTNMSRILEVNDISRRYCGEEISLEEAYKELLGLRHNIYTRVENRLAIIGICVGFSLFFGGGIAEIIATLFVGLALTGCITIGEKMKFHAFLQDVFGSFGIAVTSSILSMLVPNVNLDIVIISSIMPLVPGVAITNAVRDTLQGDYISGCARVLEAFLKAAGIAVGIALGLILMGMIGF